jgi:hypothetical protein
MRLAVALWLAVVLGCSQGKTEPRTEDPINRLEQRVEQQRRTSAQAADRYVPELTGRIDELGTPAADLLRQLPGVAAVEVLVAVKR